MLNVLDTVGALIRQDEGLEMPKRLSAIKLNTLRNGLSLYYVNK